MDAAMKTTFRIALAGNPNCGKTTIFNQLTGTRQHVGNYPGVTVERKTGGFRIHDLAVEVIDLPGVYSLSSTSPEERVAFRELVDGGIDLILNVIDSGNAQRNLYLTTQLAELDLPMVLVFNMIDDAKERGLEIDFEKFSAFFGAPVVQTVGSAGNGMDDLREMIYRIANDPAPRRPVKPKYGPKTDQAIRALTEAVEPLLRPENRRIPARYFAIKLLENDPEICNRAEFASLLQPAEEWRGKITTRNGINSETLMADYRYGVIAGACREAIQISHDRRRQLSDVIDRVVTNRFLGLPIFLVMMYLMFLFTFVLGEYPMMWLETLFEGLADLVNALWPTGQAEFFRRLVIEGIIGGVGGVLIFLPNILLLFMAIAFLEGTGYMARAAFVMDGFMHLFGLHGKSFIPMLLGFGCSVPAVMATRTIESERDRLTTILVIPFMSCGARLPIYAMIIPAFFALRYQAAVMFIMYFIGVVVALGCALLLKSTLFKGDGEVFVMELPPYRMPTFQSILIQMWERAVMYLQKAGTLILTASVILFVINTFPVRTSFTQDYPAQIAAIEHDQTLSEEERSREIAPLRGAMRAELLEYSLAGRIGKVLAIPLQAVGFDWRVSSALIGATAAKELFVAQLGVLFSIEDAEASASTLQQQLRRSYTPLQAFCIMLFCLLTIPCIATIAVVRRETGSWALTGLQIVGFTVVAYTLTFVVFQVGRLLGIGVEFLQ